MIVHAGPDWLGRNLMPFIPGPAKDLKILLTVAQQYAFVFDVGRDHLRHAAPSRKSRVEMTAVPANLDPPPEEMPFDEPIEEPPETPNRYTEPHPAETPGRPVDPVPDRLPPEFRPTPRR